MKKYMALVLVVLFGASACAGGGYSGGFGGITPSGAENMLVSTGVGAGSGALIGTAFHNPAAGALVGTGAGLLGGYLYNQWQNSQQPPPRTYYNPPSTTPAPVYYDRYGNPVTPPY
jgi:hypothetical protein